MTWNTPKVEINFADLDATENWVDVTAYVTSISTSRGRASELDRFSGGSLSVGLRNEDRRFDPTYTSSPYNPNVKPRRKIRVSVLIGITTYWLFTGYIKGWPQSVDYRTGTSIVELDCYDAFGILAQQKLQGSAYYQYVASLNPDAWYRLTDPDDSSLVLEEFGRTSMSAYGSVELGQDSGSHLSDVQKCAKFNGNRKGGIRSDDPIIDELWDFGTISWTAKSGDRHAYAENASSTLLTTDVTLWDLGGLMRCNLDMPSETTTGNYGRRGKLYVQLITQDIGVTATATVITNISVLDNQWHHYALTFDGTSLALFVDGVRVDTSLSWSGRAMEATSPVVFGERFYFGATTRGFIGQIADFVAIPFVLADSTVMELYQAWLGFPGQLSSDRINEILTWAGWAIPDREVFPTQTRLRAITDFSGSVLDACQNIADTEGGGFYVKPDGDLKHRTRYELITDHPVSVVTFGDGVGELRYMDAQLTMDEDFIFNEATFGVQGHRSYTILDSDSQAAYGPRAHPERTGMLSYSDNDAISAAQFIIQNYAEPLSRIPEIVIDARIDTNVFTWCASVVLGERITVKRKPQAVGTAWSVDTYVESIRHTIDLEQRTWITTFGLNQKGAKNTNYARVGAWILGTNPLGW